MKFSRKCTGPLLMVLALFAGLPLNAVPAAAAAAPGSTPNPRPAFGDGYWGKPQVANGITYVLRMCEDDFRCDGRDLYEVTADGMAKLTDGVQDLVGQDATHEYFSKVVYRPDRPDTGPDVQLWATDGTLAGTQLVDTAVGGSYLDAGYYDVEVVGGRFCYSRLHWVTSGSSAYDESEAACTSGTAASTGRVDAPGTPGLATGEVYIRDRYYGLESFLGGGDGTPVTLLSAPNHESSSYGVWYHGRYWFAWGKAGDEVLYSSDGTPAGTESFVGSAGTIQHVNDVFISGDRLYVEYRDYSGTTDTTGVWVTDGTDTGTHPVTTPDGAAMARCPVVITAGVMCWTGGTDTSHGKAYLVPAGAATATAALTSGSIADAPYRGSGYAAVDNLVYFHFSEFDYYLGDYINRLYVFDPFGPAVGLPLVIRKVTTADTLYRRRSNTVTVKLMAHVRIDCGRIVVSAGRKAVRTRVIHDWDGGNIFRLAFDGTALPMKRRQRLTVAYQGCDKLADAVPVVRTVRVVG